MEFENYRPDNIDKGIIRKLMEDARTPYTEIARELLVSPGTIHVRMRKMEEAGLLRNAVLMVNPARFGYDLSAFIGIFLQKGSVYKEVVTQLQAISEITEAYYTTGQYGIFIKIVCRNTDHLRQVLNEKIQAVPGIQRTETFISLEEAIKRQIQI